MKFRLISSIFYHEAKKILSMLVEGSVITRIERFPIENYVDIYFKIVDDGLDTDEEIIVDDNEYMISLLSDSVEDSSFYIDCYKLWEYRKFAVAKGFSELWKNNPYIKEEHSKGNN